MLISCVLPSCYSIKCSSGLWSPISNPSSPDFTPLNSFSAFGHSFNLTGGEFFCSNIFPYSNTGREMCLHSTGLNYRQCFRPHSQKGRLCRKVLKVWWYILCFTPQKVSGISHSVWAENAWVWSFSVSVKFLDFWGFFLGLLPLYPFLKTFL